VGEIGGGALLAVLAGLFPALLLLAAIRNRNYSTMTLAAVSTFALTAGVLVFVLAS
jgi:hypothetical protein